jgi:hypothetical protein
MATLYVAMSKGLQAWASDVGLTKHVFKLGVAEGSGGDAVEALNAGGHAGRRDWTLVAEEAADDLDEATACARLSGKETPLDPLYYPQVKGARGLFKVKLANVENHLLIATALAGGQRKTAKVSPREIGSYLIRNAAG